MPRERFADRTGTPTHAPMTAISDSIGGRVGRRDAQALLAFPRRYALRYIWQIAVYMVLILLLIEAIFLAEELVGILNRLFNALGSRAHLSDVLLVMILRTPEVFDLALPTALLVAVYRVSLQSREDREFLVIAGMGVGSQKLIALAVIVGVVAQMAALIVSGLIEPSTRFAQRAFFFEAAFRAMRDGSSSGRLYFLTNHVVYAVPQTERAGERHVFVHEYRKTSATDRVIVAESARVQGPDNDGSLTVVMEDMTIDDFPNWNSSNRQPSLRAPTGEAIRGCTDCEAPKSAPSNSVFAKTLAQKMMPDEIIRFEPRGRWPSEWSSFELARVSEGPGPLTDQHDYEIVHRFARSLLCVLAPLLAGLALTYTTKNSMAFVLPLACAFLMTFDVATTAIAKSLAPRGVWAMMVPVLLLFLAIAAFSIQQMLWRQHALVIPAQGKA